MSADPPSLPEVSVVIAAYNAAPTIADQLAALARQDVPFVFEVLVCDNGSTDDTVSVAMKWSNRLPALRIINASARRGPAAARNIGVAQSHGRFIAFCDADDVVGDTWLAELHAALQSAQFVAARIEYRRLNAQFPNYIQADEGMMFTIKPLIQYPMVGAGHMAVLKSAFMEVGGFDESLPTAEDCDLSWRLQLAGHALVGAPNAVVHIRLRETLWGVFKQAYGYGNTRRQLDHKYEKVYEAQALVPPRLEQPAQTNAQAWQTGRSAAVRAKVRRAPHKFAAIRRSRLELAPHARRIGRALGTLFSRVDSDLPQLPKTFGGEMHAPTADSREGVDP